MSTSRYTCRLVAGLALLSIGAEATATAFLGGGVGTSFSAGSGLCTKSKLVPLDTPQDVFSLSLAATCPADGSSASGDLHAEAAGGSIGMRLTAAGESSVAAQVAYHDDWLLKVAPGTLAGTYTIPVTFKLEGNVAAGSIAPFGRFVDYSFSARDLYAGLGPTTFFAVTGNVTATGAYLQSFAGTVDFRYFGPTSALPATAEIELNLRAQQLEKGTIDFFNTASVTMALPDGWSAATSSGLPVVFAPVPEPATGALWALGLLALLPLCSRRRASAANRR